MNEGLDDRASAAHAWARYRLLLAWMTTAAFACAAAAIMWLAAMYGPLGWTALLTTIGGVAGSVMMAGALMGLVFLSSGTGHDAQVRDTDFSARTRHDKGRPR